jgi:glycosyltransferase involved in cell wall biosynthesis
VLALVPCSPYMPSGIVRVEQYAERLRARGVRLHVVNYFSPAARVRRRWIEGPRSLRTSPARALARAALAIWDSGHLWAVRLLALAAAPFVDAIVVQWVLPPVWWSRLATRLNRRVIYDLDDAVFLSSPPRAEALARRAWRVVVGSHHLQAFAAPLNPATVLVPSSVPVEAYPPGDGEREEAAHAPLRLGWIGSPGTLPYLTELEVPLRALAAAGVEVELVIAGVGGRHDLLPEVRQPVRLVDQYRSAELPALAASFDVGLFPLPDAPWERGKSAMKALIYMAAARPVVCSPVGENAYVVVDGETGFTAADAPSWTARITELARDPALRARLGSAGRARAEAFYSTDACFNLLWQQVYGVL